MTKTEFCRAVRTNSVTLNRLLCPMPGTTRGNGEVPIYDTCDEVRRKINAHLRKMPGLTDAEFRRTLFAQLHKTKAMSIKFSAHYAAYVYFEKMRLARGKPESTHREMMEQIHYPGGVDCNVNSRARYAMIDCIGRNKGGGDR